MFLAGALPSAYCSSTGSAPSVAAKHSRRLRVPFTSGWRRRSRGFRNRNGCGRYPHSKEFEVCTML
jgi:hypothetical protein